MANTRSTKNKSSQTTEVSDAVKNIRNFKQSSNVESFYRFIHENRLRREAGLILTKITDALGTGRKKSKRKNKKTRIIQ